jgi:hypothetical protein
MAGLHDFFSLRWSNQLVAEFPERSGCFHRQRWQADQSSVAQTANYSACRSGALNNTTITLGCSNIFGQDPQRLTVSVATHQMPGLPLRSTGRFVYVSLTKKFYLWDRGKPKRQRFRPLPLLLFRGTKCRGPSVLRITRLFVPATRSFRINPGSGLGLESGRGVRAPKSLMKGWSAL